MLAAFAVSSVFADVKELTEIETVSDWRTYGPDTYITGIGGFKVKNGLIFNQGGTYSNDFSGGVEVELGGYLQSKVWNGKGTPFGSGPITLHCDGTKTCGLSGNGITLTQKVTTTGDSSARYPALDGGYTTFTLNDLEVGGDLYLTTSYATGQNRYWTQPFLKFSSKEVDATGYTVGFATHGTIVFDKALHCRNLVGSSVTNGTEGTIQGIVNGYLGGLVIGAQSNRIESIVLDSQFIRCNANNAIVGASLRFEGQHACCGPDYYDSGCQNNLTNQISGYVDINYGQAGKTCTQTFRWIESDERAYDQKVGYIVQNSQSSKGTVVIGGEADKTATAYVALNGAENLTIAETAPASFRQVFRGRESTMTGEIVVKGGTLKLAGGATFANVRKVTLSGSGRLEIAAGTNPFAEDAVDLTLGKGTALVLPTGTKLRVKTLTVRGETYAAGTYSAADVPGLSGGEIVSASGGSGIKISRWVGGATGVWNDETNWEPEFLPGGDRIAFFDTEATVNGDPIAIAAGGLVISNSALVVIKAKITGAGRLVKTAGGDLKLDLANNDYAGGTVVENGCLYINQANVLGTGPLEIRRTTGCKPWIYVYNKTVTNDVFVTGATPNGSQEEIRFNNNGTISGKVTTEGDFLSVGRYQSGSEVCGFTGGIAASGHKIRLTAFSNRSIRYLLKGEIDAAIQIDGKLTECRNMAKMTNPDTTYLMKGTTNTCYITTVIAATNVVIDNSDSQGARLRLFGTPLAANATLSLVKGAKVEFMNAVPQQTVAALKVDGVDLAPGVYTAANLPGSIVGEGSIRVKRPGRDGLAVLLKGKMPSKTLFFAGDSTLDNHKGDESVYGSWGYSLRFNLRPGNTIKDYARSGYGTQTFIDQGYWGTLLSEVKSGDYVVIQFGHNDQKVDKTHGCKLPQYQENLERMIGDVKAKGGNPIIATSIIRCQSSDGKYTDEDGTKWWTLRDYADAAVAAATAGGCPVVEMNNLTRAEVEAVTYDYAYTMYYNEGIGDRTHPCPAGGRRFAQLFLNDVKSRALPVAELFR